MKIIVGLGNPGSKYEFTRHNAGFLFIDYISQQYHISVDKLKFKSLYGQGMINGQKVLLLKPQTFMNLSGEAVLSVLDYYKAEPEDLILIYDDISLVVGKMRIRQKGSAGGHNGIKSIIYLNHTDVFERIKIGIGRPQHNDYGLVDYVLGGFSKEEQKVIFEVFKSAASALELMVNNQCYQAMNLYNNLDKNAETSETK